MKKLYITKVSTKIHQRCNRGNFRKRTYRETVEKFLKDDIDLKRTDKLLKIIIFAAVFELLYKHNNPKK